MVIRKGGACTCREKSRKGRLAGVCGRNGGVMLAHARLKNLLMSPLGATGIPLFPPSLSSPLCRPNPLSAGVRACWTCWKKKPAQARWQ